MELTTQIAAVGSVLALLYATLAWLRRRGVATISPKAKGCNRLEALDRLRLGPQHTLHLVRLGDTALVVASSPSGCALLESRPWGEVQRKETVQ